MADHAAKRSLCIRLDGEFGLADKDRLATAFTAVTSRDLVVLNFARTTYRDSTVLYALCGLQNTVERNGGKLVLTDLSATVRRLFELTHLDSVFDIRNEADLAASPIDLDATQSLTITTLGEANDG